jgi:hypothetical protein
MYPPIFAVCSASSAVKALVGNSPVRLYPFGEAPQGVIKPYVVWQVIGGSPENYINQVPDVDYYSLQVDVYGDDAASVRGVAEALRDAIEPVAYITAWRGESRDPETRDYRYSFDIDWHVLR